MPIITTLGNSDEPYSLIESLPEEKSNTEPVYTWQQIFYRTLTVGSVALGPLFAYFLYQSIISLDDVDEKDSSWLTIVFSIIAIYLSLANFLGKPASINPIEDAENLVKRNNLTDAETTRYSRAFIVFNTSLSIPSFIHYSADNVIAIADLSKNNRKIYLAGIPFAMLFTVYYHVFAKKDIEHHTNRFIKSLSNMLTRQSLFFQLLKSPLKFFQFSIEACSDIAYQSISVGYIADQLAKIFDLDETHPAVMPWIFCATFLTAYINAFSRTLPFYDSYFNPEFDTLTQEELANITLSKKDLALDTLVSLSRAISLTWLGCRFGPQGILNKTLFATSTCVGAFSHHFYVSHQKRKHETAIEHRRTHLLMPINQSVVSDVENPLLATPEVLFDKIADSYETPAVRNTITVLNISACIAQLLSFIRFESDILETAQANHYALQFNFKDMVALAFLWATPIIVIEAKMNQGPLIKSVTYHIAKVNLGAPTEAIAKRNRFSRMLGTLFAPKDQYTLGPLQQALRKRQGQEDEEEMVLMRHTPS